ncbi:hypothetical protein GTY57_07245 [Streptomyces sp. SID5475]|nr:hypothetical protein [Streptomyces sp. SID5475]
MEGLLHGRAPQLRPGSQLSLGQPSAGQPVGQPHAEFGERRIALSLPIQHVPAPTLVCSQVFIFAWSDHGAQRFRDLRQRQRLAVFLESAVSGLALILLTAAVVMILALLAAAGAGKLARLDGATYPAALTRAAAAFIAVLTLAATCTAALAGLLA